MGDAKAGPVGLSFNPQLRVEFRGATVTSDAGLLLPRELDERLGLNTLIERHLASVLSQRFDDKIEPHWPGFRRPSSSTRRAWAQYC